MRRLPPQGFENRERVGGERAETGQFVDEMVVGAPGLGVPKALDLGYKTGDVARRGPLVVGLRFGARATGFFDGPGFALCGFELRYVAAPVTVPDVAAELFSAVRVIDAAQL